MEYIESAQFADCVLDLLNTGEKTLVELLGYCFLTALDQLGQFSGISQCLLHRGLQQLGLFPGQILWIAGTRQPPGRVSGLSHRLLKHLRLAFEKFLSTGKSGLVGTHQRLHVLPLGLDKSTAIEIRQLVGVEAALHLLEERLGIVAFEKAGEVKRIIRLRSHDIYP